MGLRFDSPASASDFILSPQEAAGGTASVSGNGSITLTALRNSSVTAGLGITLQGDKQGEGDAAVTGAGQLVVNGGLSGTRFDSVTHGNAYVLDEVTSLAPASTPADATVTGGGQVICNGQKDTVGGYLINVHGDLTTQGEKNAIGLWFVEFWVNNSVSIEKGGEYNLTLSGGGQVTADGRRDTQAFVTGNGTVDVTQEKGAEQAAAVTGEGTLSASGFKFEQPAGTAVVTTGGQVTASGTTGEVVNKVVVLSGGGGLTGAVEKLAAGVAAIAATGLLTGTPSKGAEQTLSISGNGTIIAEEVAQIISVEALLGEITITTLRGEISATSLSGTIETKTLNGRI